LAGLTAVAFASAVPNGFVGIDHWQIESGGLIAHSWPDLWKALREPLGAMPGWEGSAPYARPSVILLLSLVHQLGGVDPRAYHLTAVLIHLANVLLAYGFLCALAVEPPAAFFASAIFAVHPLQTAAVSWISGIADPLCTLFVLIALRLQFATTRRQHRRGWLSAAAALSFLYALGAKETAAMLPLLLIVAYQLFPMLTPSPSDRPLRRGRAILAMLAPFLLVLAAAALYRVAVLHGAAVGAAFGAIPLSVRLRTVPRLIVSYLTLPLRLGSLTVCDDYALSVRWESAAILATLAVVGLLVGLIACRRRAPQAAFGLIWVLLGLAPVLGIAPILHYRADRFFYLPFIGWSLAMVTLLQRVVQRIAPAARLRRAPVILASAAVLALMALTIRRNALFADDVTLFEATVAASPLCREAHTALGDAYLRAGRAGDGVAQYEAARAPEPERASYIVLPKVLINLGMAHLARADYAAADAAFSEAHAQQPELLHPLFGLGIANLGLGRIAAAVTWLEQAHDRAPDDPDIVLNLAIGYDRLGRPSDALPLYHRYLDVAPRGRERSLAEERIRLLRERVKE